MVSGKFEVPEHTMMFSPLRSLNAVSATFFRSAMEKDGNSPVVPSTTTPSAPLAFRYASRSLYSSSSNFKSFPQGVDAATQNKTFSRHCIVHPQLSQTHTILTDQDKAVTPNVAIAAKTSGRSLPSLPLACCAIRISPRSHPCWPEPDTIHPAERRAQRGSLERG